jgi:hypothetical protein
MSGPVAPEPIDAITNPPGLGAVAYAHGRYASLRAMMLDTLARDTKYLRDLNSRDPADPTIALIDCWAVAGDVLGFYAERIANESWLPTATERRSLRSLARLIDYELRPGKAAEAWLAFTVEDAPGAPLEVPIPLGTRVQSIPGPGETMVTFETVEAITGRPHFSAMRPRMERDQSLDDVLNAQSALCQGVITDVRRGDWLLLVHGSKQLFRAESVVADAPSQTTEITFTAQPSRPFIFLPLLKAFYPLTVGFAGRKLGPTLVGEEITGKRRKQVALESEFRAARIDTHKLSLHLNLSRFIVPILPAPEGLFHFKGRAAVFGHNVPNEADAGSPASPSPPLLSSGTTTIALDAEYSELRPGSWVAFVTLFGSPFIAKVTQVDTLSKRLGRLTARVTQITLDNGIPSSMHGTSTATVTVLVDSRPLALAPIPVSEDVTGSELRLDRYLPDLEIGRPVAVTGERSDLPGVVESEVHKIADIELDDGLTVLTLETAITGPFLRGSVRVNGNVARGTHGESGGQPIGHGDGSATGQSFTLPVVPLTQIGAANPRGLAAALAIRVDGLLWTEVPSLRDAGPNDRVYQLRYGEDEAVSVVFGDGINGRRLPTGVNNVVAWWRKGLGREGMVKPGQLSLLSGAPQGVKAVTNPLSATGAADGETLAEARTNAPLSVMTLDRIITLRDYEDFARSFGGIAKAKAVWSWNGSARTIALTVAGVGGDVPADRDVANLAQAIADASDGHAVVTILPYRPASFRVAAKLRTDPAFAPDAVSAAVVATLNDRFSFDKRNLGQPVFRSEVIATIQTVPGVDWVDLDSFYRGDTPSLAEALFAEAPRSGLRLGLGAQPLGAELLTIHPAGPDLTVNA